MSLWGSFYGRDNIEFKLFLKTDIMLLIIFVECNEAIVGQGF